MEDDERLVFRVATPWLWWTIYEPGQRWTFLRALNVLIFILVSPLLIVGALVGQIFSRPARRDGAEVARYLCNEAQGKSSFRDWDDFTSIPIANPELDAIRIQAASLSHPPSEHQDELLALADRARQFG